jgi:hypothetical protein
MLFREAEFSVESPIIKQYAAYDNSERSEHESVVAKHSAKYKETPLLSYNPDSFEENECLGKISESMLESNMNDSLENTIQEHVLHPNL